MAISFGNATTLWSATSASSPSSTQGHTSSGSSSAKVGNFMLTVEWEYLQSFAPSGYAVVVRSYSLADKNNIQLVSRALLATGVMNSQYINIQSISDTVFFVAHENGSTGCMRFGSIDASGNISLKPVATIGIAANSFTAAVVDKTRRAGVAGYNQSYQGYATSFSYDANYGITIRNTLGTAYSVWKTSILNSGMDNAFCLLYRDYNTNKGEWRKGSVDSGGYLSLGAQSNLFNTSDVAQFLGRSQPMFETDGRVIATHTDRNYTFFDLCIVDTNTKTAGNTVRVSQLSGGNAYPVVVPDQFQSGKGIILAPMYFPGNTSAIIPFAYSGLTLSVDTAGATQIPTNSWAQSTAISCSAGQYAAVVAVPNTIPSPTYLAYGKSFSFGGSGDATPGKPSNLLFPVATSTSMKMTWTAGSGATGYNVKVNDGTPTAIGDVLEYTFTGLNPNTAYTFSVESTNSAGSSGYVSSASQFRTKANPPQNLRVSNLKQQTFRVNWDAPVTGADSYNIYMDSGSGFVLVTNTYQTYYDFNNMLPGTSYRFVVESVNSAGNSIQTGTFMMTTPPNVPTATNTELRAPIQQPSQNTPLQEALVVTAQDSPIVYTPVWEDDVVYSYLLNGVPVSSNADNCLEVSNLRDGVPAAIQATAAESPNTIQEVLIVPPIDMLGIIRLDSGLQLSTEKPDVILGWSRFKVNPAMIVAVRLYFVTCEIAPSDLRFQKGYLDIPMQEYQSKTITLTNAATQMTSAGLKYAIAISAKDFYNEGHISNKVLIDRI